MFPFCYIWAVVQQAQRFGVMGADVLRMKLIAKFELSAS